LYRDNLNLHPPRATYGTIVGMRHLFRWVFNSTVAVSAMLGAALAWFWLSGYLLGWSARGYRHHLDGLGDSDYRLNVVGGGLEFAVQTFVISASALAAFREKGYTPNRNEIHLERLGSNDYPHRPLRSGATSFDAWRNVSISSSPVASITDDGLIVPCWFAFVVLSVCPSLWLIRRQRRVSIERGKLCAACGYDLRATTERCPECGKVPTVD